MTSTSGQLNDSVDQRPAEPRTASRTPIAGLGHRRWAQGPKAYGMTVAGAGIAALGFGLWLGGIWPTTLIAQYIGVNPATAWGLPLTRMLVDVAAIGTMGMLITCVLLPRKDRELSAVAHRCLRSASGLALAWGAATAALLIFSWSDVTGLPITALPINKIFAGSTGGSFPDAVPFLFCAVLALIISVAADTIRTRRGAAVLLLLAGYNLLPLTTTGHAQHSPVNAYAVTAHVVAVTAWVGGLAGVLIHVRRSPALMAVVVPRFSSLALACFAVVGASGVVMAWANLTSVSDIWGSRYGLLMVCKLVGLITVGCFGWRHRRRTVRAVAERRDRRAFIRLAAAEVVVMVCTVALGVALSRAPTPDTVTVPGGLHSAPLGHSRTLQ